MKDWPENRVSDGEWHRVTFDYFDNVSSISWFIVSIKLPSLA